MVTYFETFLKLAIILDMALRKNKDFTTSIVIFFFLICLFLDLEWKIIYVGSAESEEYDQILDSVLVGPVPAGRHMFVFQVGFIFKKSLMVISFVINFFFLVGKSIKCQYNLFKKIIFFTCRLCIFFLCVYNFLESIIKV